MEFFANMNICKRTYVPYLPTLVVEAALRCCTTMASDVKINSSSCLPTFLGMWDSLPSFWFAPGALATAADALSCSQRSTQLNSTWELVLFYILLFTLFFFLDNISFSSSIPVTHLKSDGPSFLILDMNSLPTLGIV